jgi:Zn-dependent protease
MIHKKEFWLIVAISIVLAFTISLIRSWQLLLYSLALIFLVILVNIFAKKIIAYYFSSEIEIKLWEIERYGFKPQKYFKKPFPAGVFLPILITVLSVGNFIWLASLIFEIKPKTYRTKKKSLYKFSEITEETMGLIAAIGIAANLIFAFIAYLINVPDLARLSIYYACFNLIPYSSLDGNKIFFGKLSLWAVLGVISLLALFYALVLI